MTHVGWASGRMIWLTAGLALSCIPLVYVAWWINIAGPWAPFEDPYYLPGLEGIPTIAGIIAIFGILPRMAWVDAQAVTNPRGTDILAVSILIAGFAALPTFTRLLIGANPLYAAFVPEQWGIADPTALDTYAPLGLFVAHGLNIAIALSLTVAMTGLLGGLLGPITGPLCYLALLAAQGYRIAPILLPRVPDSGEWISNSGIALTAVAFGIGVTAFGYSHSGTRTFTLGRDRGSRIGRAPGDRAVPAEPPMTR